MHHSVSHCGFCPNQWLWKELQKPSFEISSAQSNSLHVNCKSLPGVIRLDQRSNLNRSLPFLMMQETWQGCFGGKPTKQWAPPCHYDAACCDDGDWKLDAVQSPSCFFSMCFLSFSCKRSNWATLSNWAETETASNSIQTVKIFRMLKMCAMLSVGSNIESWVSSGVHFPWMMAPHSQIMPTLLDAWKIMKGCATNLARAKKCAKKWIALYWILLRLQ